MTRHVALTEANIIRWVESSWFPKSWSDAIIDFNLTTPNARKHFLDRLDHLAGLGTIQTWTHEVRQTRVYAGRSSPYAPGQTHHDTTHSDRIDLPLQCECRSHTWPASAPS